MGALHGRTRWLVAAMLSAFAATAAPAAADAPLEGHWRFGQAGATIEFRQTGPGHFAGTVRDSKGKTNCSGNVNGVQVTASSETHYTGTNRFYLVPSCELFGSGNVDITLSDDGLSGTYKGDPPPSASCCSETVALRRDPLATQPDLPALVNSILVGLQKRYKQIVKSGKSKPKGMLKALGAAARTGYKKVQAYKANANEKKLQTCAVKALKQVESGAKVKTERAGRGLTATAKCLKGFASDLPNGKPGTPAPPGAKPGGPVLDGHYVGQNGAGAKAGNFSLDVKSGFVGNFNFSIWTPSKCNGGRGPGFSPFDTPQKRALNSDGTFTYSLSNGVTTINISGLISNGRGSGTLSVSFSEIPQCNTGTLQWSVARR